MDFAERWGTVWDDDCRRCQCVCLDTGSTSEKRSPMKRERSGSRDSASSSRSSRASSKSRRESPPLGCLEISDVDGFSLELGRGDLEELAFWAGAGGREELGRTRGSVAPFLDIVGLSPARACVGGGRGPRPRAPGWENRERGAR